MRRLGNCRSPPKLGWLPSSYSPPTNPYQCPTNALFLGTYPTLLCLITVHHEPNTTHFLG